MFRRTVAALVAGCAACASAMPTEARDDTIPNVYLPLNYRFGQDHKVSTDVLLPGGHDTLEVVVDQGSENFWMFGPGSIMNYGSTALGAMGPCNISVHPFYDNRISETATEEVPYDFGNGYGSFTKIVRGNSTTNDTITFQSDAGQKSTIKNTRFVLADSMIYRLPVGESCLEFPFDKAIMGIMAFNPQSAMVSFRQDLLDNGVIENPVISLWFDQAPAKVDGTFTGGTVFGAVDSSKYTGPLIKVPWIKPEGNLPFSYYVPPPTSNLNGKDVTDPNTTSDIRCLVDSGTQIDTLPMSEDLLLSAGLVRTPVGALAYPGPCESIPRDKTLDLTFAGSTAGTSITIKVPIRNYARSNADLNNIEYCGLNLEAISTSCLLGAPFASSAFFAADDANDEIAFAQGGISEPGSGVDETALKKDLADAL